VLVIHVIFGKLRCRFVLNTLLSTFYIRQFYNTTWCHLAKLSNLTFAFDYSYEVFSITSYDVDLSERDYYQPRYRDKVIKSP